MVVMLFFIEVLFRKLSRFLFRFSLLRVLRYFRIGGNLVRLLLFKLIILSLGLLVFVGNDWIRIFLLVIWGLLLKWSFFRFLSLFILMGIVIKLVFFIFKYKSVVLKLWNVFGVKICINDLSWFIWSFWSWIKWFKDFG